MASSSPIITVVQVSKVSPPPSTLQNRSLALTDFDMLWISTPPVNHVFFYDLPGITRTHFTKTILPTLNRSLSTTLQYFFPYAGNLIIFPTPNKKPEIRYVQGDHVSVTYSECNLDFNDLTGNHPRYCEKFYHLISPLGPCPKMSDHKKIAVFSVQITLFPNHGICLGTTSHHCIGDATTQLTFFKAWALISQSGTDELFLARKTFPFYNRSVLINYPKDFEEVLKEVDVETLYQEYEPSHLSGPSDKLRATFIMTQSVVNGLKKIVSTEVPTLAHVSSFTTSCAYIWTCLAKSCKTHELSAFIFALDCRARMDPPIPATYFGNCVMFCANKATATDLLKNEGSVNIAKLLGDNLHKLLTTEGGIVMAEQTPFSEMQSRTLIGVAGSPKTNFYDMDFGWGNPKKHEIISTDYRGSISVGACKESTEDLEIGICGLSAIEMQAFVRTFFEGVQDVRPKMISKF